VEHGQIDERDQHPDDARRFEGDLHPAPAHDGRQLGPQRVRPGRRGRHAGGGEEQRPPGRLEQDGVKRQRGGEERQTHEQDEATAERGIHVSGAPSGSRR
jgi:hypothetical protein